MTEPEGRVEPAALAELCQATAKAIDREFIAAAESAGLHPLDQMELLQAALFPLVHDLIQLCIVGSGTDVLTASGEAALVLANIVQSDVILRTKERQN